VAKNHGAAWRKFKKNERILICRQLILCRHSTLFLEVVTAVFPLDLKWLVIDLKELQNNQALARCSIKFLKNRLLDKKEEGDSVKPGQKPSTYNPRYFARVPFGQSQKLIFKLFLKVF